MLQVGLRDAGVCTFVDHSLARLHLMLPTDGALSSLLKRDMCALFPLAAGVRALVASLREHGRIHGYAGWTAFTLGMCGSCFEVTSL